MHLLEPSLMRSRCFSAIFVTILPNLDVSREETEKWEGTERHIVKQLRPKNSFLMKITHGIKINTNGGNKS